MNYCYWVRGHEHAEMARLSIDSVLRVDPGAKCTVITDEPALTPDIANAKRMQLPPGRPAMVANLDAQIAYLSAPWVFAGTEVLFLDADVLLRRVVDFQGADLMATWRDHVGYSEGEKVSGVATLMPYNYGVFGMKAGPLMLEALLWMRARILRMASQYQAWYGNQLALAELLGKAPSAGSANRVAHIRWTPMDAGTPFRALLLPCETHNYSPESETEDVSAKYILHLKGARKAWMSAYARAA